MVHSIVIRGAAHVQIGGYGQSPQFNNSYIAVIAGIVLRYSKYGRHIYAVGGNQEATRLSGLNVDRLILSVYVIMGFFAGLSGFLLSSRLNSAEQVAGLGFELTVIASVVIGGTSLFGGEGNIFGTVVGVLLIGVLANGLEEYYRNRNLLKARITATHVGRAVLFFATRQTPTTGATIPVDGGLPDSTPR